MQANYFRVMALLQVALQEDEYVESLVSRETSFRKKKFKDYNVRYMYTCYYGAVISHSARITSSCVNDIIQVKSLIENKTHHVGRGFYLVFFPHKVAQAVIYVFVLRRLYTGAEQNNVNT